CHFVGRHVVEGPNWKLAYEGFLDQYHLPILHRAIFGTDISTKAVYDGWGPHQRVTAPDRHFARLAGIPEDEWQSADLDGGIWAVFPNVAIAPLQAYSTREGASRADGR